jgi:hypothetical protein
MVVLIVMIMMSLWPLRLTLKRRNDKRAGKVGSKHGEEEEFALGIDVRALGEIVAQVTTAKVELGLSSLHVKAIPRLKRIC